jgi:hypothetical protein
VRSLEVCVVGLHVQKGVCFLSLNDGSPPGNEPALPSETFSLNVGRCRDHACLLITKLKPETVRMGKSRDADTRDQSSRLQAI